MRLGRILVAIVACVSFLVITGTAFDGCTTRTVAAGPALAATPAVSAAESSESSVPPTPAAASADASATTDIALSPSGVSPRATAPPDNTANSGSGTPQTAPPVAPSASPSTAPSDPNQKTAYLTFDDGPSRLTGKLLDVLNGCNVRATFFVIGLNAEKNPDVLKRMISDGDVIGIHSWTHQYSYIYRNLQNFLDDFNKLKNFLTQTTGVAPTICRFPGGTNNTVCFTYNKEHIMKTIVSTVQDMGFKYYDWNVSSGEAGDVHPSTSDIVKSVVGQCQGKKAAVILFHDYDVQGYVDAVPKIVAALRAAGFAFDTLSPDKPADAKVAQFKPA